MSKYQLFPTLDPATEAALRASIRRWGVLQPIVKDQDGNIIDGHHRARIAAEIGADCPVKVRAVVDDNEAREIAQSLNTDRRHLDPDMRRQVVADLRVGGHSLRAIAGAVGVSAETVRQDLAGVNPLTPHRIKGTDGKWYPSTHPKPAEVAVALAAAEPERTPEDVEAEAAAITETTDDTDQGVIDAVESRRTPQAVPKKASADGVPPHPATYPQAVLDIFAEYVAPIATGYGEGEPAPIVFDPFGGIGGIHKLRDMADCTTVAIEIEPEWAAAHPGTICGDARDGRELLHRAGALDAYGHVQVIATSPAYGNRLADDYNASDPHARRSYAIDLGRSLTPGSAAGMHFDKDGGYEALHGKVWWDCVTLLEPGGLFLLNCKDFQRDGAVVPVTGWHVAVLAEMGLVVVDIRTLPAAGLPFTTAKPLSELVVVFRKPYVPAELLPS